MPPEDSGRLTVSKDFLRAELGGLELRLVDRLANKDDVDELTKRVVELEIHGSPADQETRKDVKRLLAWRYYVAGGIGACAFLAGGALGVALKVFG